MLKLAIALVVPLLGFLAYLLLAHKFFTACVLVFSAGAVLFVWLPVPDDHSRSDERPLPLWETLAVFAVIGVLHWIRSQGFVHQFNQAVISTDTLLDRRVFWMLVLITSIWICVRLRKLNRQ